MADLPEAHIVLPSSFALSTDTLGGLLLALTTLFHSESLRNSGGRVVVLRLAGGGGLRPLVLLLQPASPTHHCRMSS